MQINERCPLSSECGKRKCEHIQSEIECGYYNANARPGAEIADQEALRWQGIDEVEVTIDGRGNGKLVYLPVGKLHPHPDNPRKDLGDLTELADSIRANGIYQNLTVVPLVNADPDATVSAEDDQFTVVIGHRRLAAAKLAGLSEVPCVVATNMDHREQVQTMLLENMQRSDLTVYEQAQGFQMMLDLGATVDEIAQKAGFSATTVRRRVKMTELDQEKLKEVSTRQLSLGDFDTLAQIEDIKERNKALESIGTRDFEISVRRAINKQQVKKNMPLVKKWLKEVGATEISQSDTWSNKYEGYPGCQYYIYVARWGEEENKPPKTLKDPVFYHLDTDTLRLYKKRDKPRTEKEKKSDKEIARNKAINQAWDALEAAYSLAYDLRRAFVEKLTVNTKNRSAILAGALAGALLESLCYNSPNRDAACKVFGINTDSYDSERDKKLAEGMEHLDDKDIPSLVYYTFGDKAKEMCAKTSYRGTFPEYEPSAKLTMIYRWLTSLGYEMSTEETQLLNGEHEAYRACETYIEQEAPGA